MIRIIVAEDSPVQREFLVYLLEEAGGFDIVATPGNGMDAVAETAALRPDIVLMDCHMPKLDGITAAQQIMEQCPTPVVIVSASLAQDDTRIAFDALKNGALAVVLKPTSIESPDFDRLARELVQTLRLMSEVKVVRRWPAAPKPVASATPARAARASPLRVIAIAGSTGAPAITADILAAVAPNLSAPVLVVQHLAEAFVDGFALWLGQRTKLPVRVARHGLVAERGAVYIAPDDYHLGMDRSGCLVLSDDPAEEGFRPCANYLFRSVAASYGRSALGIVLTGMGRDGAAGLLELRQTGAVTVAQDEESCIVFGMPGEAVRLQAAAYVLDPAQIAAMITSWRGS